MKPIAIKATGMITGVGLNAPASCAAIRCAIDCFAETRFMVQGEWLIGSEVPLTPPSRGREKMLRMALAAVGECLAGASGLPVDRVPLLLCLAEADRPGRFDGLDATLIADVERMLGVKFHPASAVLTEGRVGGAKAVVQARKLLDQGCAAVIVAGADTFLVASTLASYEEKGRLLTAENSNGFIPGEAAGAVLFVDAEKDPDADFVCLGVGFGQEKATIESEEPLRGDGLMQAFKAVFADSGKPLSELDYRITDANGEQYWFKEAALALDRCLRNRIELFDIWHPADCIGEVGAAIGPCIFAVADAAARKGYAAGRGPLCHFGSDGEDRAALIFDFNRRDVN
jgi:3-oxoacyl-[acyl-carrier-protein] synthase-1